MKRFALQVDPHQGDINNEMVNASTNMSARATDCEFASSSPDWDQVPFDVGCARCGHDLRGLTAPRCPACGLEFDWSNAVPIEELTCQRCEYHLFGLRKTRCPECGEPFTWEEALAAHYRRKKPLFEYRWRHQPLRSLFYSWRLAVYPGKLWRIIDIHDPPQVKPLLFTFAVTIVALLILGTTMNGLHQWSSSRLFWRGPGYGDLPMFLLWRGLFNAEAYLFPLIVATWAATSFGALIVFRQSMHLCRVRTVHVLRVWAYTVMSVLPLAPLFAYVGEYIPLYFRLRVNQRWFPEIGPYALIPLLVLVIWSLRQGYRHYLRIPHSLAVAVASQVIALLAVPAILDGLPRVLGLW